MNDKKHKRSNKRELLEADKYTKHAKAKPYDRTKLNDDTKREYLNHLLGDWDAMNDSPIKQ